MKRFNVVLTGLFAAALAVSCNQASIRGTLQGAMADDQVAVGRLEGATVQMLDTVRTDKDGRYACKVEVEKGQPAFIYLYHNGNRIASLLLSKGEQVTVVSDSLGSWTVEGSEESARLQQVEQEFSDFLKKMDAAYDASDRAALAKTYVDYYRSRVRYLMENTKSLTSIPVLYQKINDHFPVFGQATDALHFRTVYDSLMTVYPESKYVKALGQEATSRMNVLELNAKISQAQVTAYPELDLPSIDGTRKKLSETTGKVLMLYFWVASDPMQKMFNREVMLPVYKDYHDKGFEIYSVSLDTDKGVWASAVRDQDLPWINVCDGLGSASPAASLYNVYRNLPVSFLIVDGELNEVELKGEKDLRSFLAKTLK